MACRILVSQPKIKFMPPCLERERRELRKGARGGKGIPGKGISKGAEGAILQNR